MSNERNRKSRREDSAISLHAALSSPMRLELVGLFTEPDPLSIAEMAARLGRPATSLYHHVQVLEDAGALRKAGTRPKGKRFETLYEIAESRLELAVDQEDETATRQAGRMMSAALRMADRDFEAALGRDDIRTDGSTRNLTGMRMHMRLSPRDLARLNARLKAVEDLLQSRAVADAKPGPDDQFVSLTLLLAPLRGRRVDLEEPAADQGDPS